ncbi:glycerophosphodiester phosphodiesterase [Pseudogemmobacter sonorensis]|uniref:glycerophosphodiester phosphodiesterase n=1 Tax=Pseudogemmobacter sonorensis TaxID=2989681 RepID=UPI0036914C6F
MDILRHAGGGFAILHDEMLDRGTTGTGPVAQADADLLRRLRRRDDAGRETAVRVALLEDLCADLVADPAAPGGGHLQFDLKNRAAELTAADLAAFVRAVAPIAGRMVLSGGDARAVGRLAEALPGLATGHDPCLAAALDTLRESRDSKGSAPVPWPMPERARVIYLDRALVFFAEDCGFDLIAGFQAEGRVVDVWTLPGAQGESLAQLHRLMALGADHVTADDPLGLWTACRGAKP